MDLQLLSAVKSPCLGRLDLVIESNPQSPYRGGFAGGGEAGSEAGSEAGGEAGCRLNASLERRDSSATGFVT